MHRYIVEVPEIHVIRYFVDAESPEEAFEKITRGEAEYAPETLRFERQSSPRAWRIVEEGGERPPRARSARRAANPEHVFIGPRNTRRG